MFQCPFFGVVLHNFLKFSDGCKTIDRKKLKIPCHRQNFYSLVLQGETVSSMKIKRHSLIEHNLWPQVSVKGLFWGIVVHRDRSSWWSAPPTSHFQYTHTRTHTVLQRVSVCVAYAYTMQSIVFLVIYHVCSASSAEISWFSRPVNQAFIC